MGKRLVLLMVLILTAIGLMFPPQAANAEDVWIGNDAGTDLYIITDTIYAPNENAVKVTTKYVRNSTLEKVDLWSFGRFRGEWRYSTEKMRQRGRTGSIYEGGELIPRILNYCLDYLSKNK